MAAGRLARAIPSNTVSAFLQTGASTAWLGAGFCPTWIPSAGKKFFGLVVLELQEGSPAATASLLSGDILLGTEEQRFAVIADLHCLLDGPGLRQVRLEFLRGDYNRVGKVTVLLGHARRSSQARAA